MGFTNIVKQSDCERLLIDIQMRRKIEHRITLRKLVMFFALLTLFGIIYFGYFCSDNRCSLSYNPKPAIYSEWTVMNLLSTNITDFKSAKDTGTGVSYNDMQSENQLRFDMNAHDVMVFLHIQKTGGTSFGRHLVQDLDLQRPCTCQRKRKLCYCFRPSRNENWLFSRYSTGWKCGLHADFTELTGCVDSELDKNEGKSIKRRYFYLTLLRDPVSRYLSEYKHVQRGATWRMSRHWCGGHPASLEELPKCYNGTFWTDVTLNSFADCPYNLAANRQTRMLADLSLIGCYNSSYMNQEERNRVMLASAKRNLLSIAFFGLTEFQKLNQYIFEETFNLRFAVTFTQHNTTLSAVYKSLLNAEELEKVKKINALDIELYNFAKHYLFRRFEKLRAKNPNFKERWAHLGQLPSQTAFDWEKEVETEAADNEVNYT
ncbi:heparan-sulfate 6-O-sulfotransferase 2 [Melanaphis sacchari]|uniref:Heparan-sulfate 6-O-sulfotransferase n=1 Tax=Melanaphis sacchari TaxID=742174 RepID=A0A2H8TNF4_9HEMI|nr:heparan-sulfate 6-O-sulfotransferase 2 [Melanaphis sacchari]